MNSKFHPFPFLRRMTFASFLIATILLSWKDSIIGRINFGVQFANAAETAASEKVEGVIQLTAKNFDKNLSDGNVWLIEFYAPWCSHCTRFAPSYEVVAQKLHSDRSNNKRKVKVAKIDGAAERALSSRFSVKGFPTFFLVDGWTVREFEGNRSQENLINFATETYEEVEPMPFLFGPFGPMGQLRSFLMRSGTWAVGLYENLTEERGMKPLVAVAVLCLGGMVVGMIMIVVLGLFMMSKLKQD
ncbi:hypothetical protein ACHAXM_011931 [Skeletonema potamos]|jgi:protein disulfide-isomerase-like protein